MEKGSARVLCFAASTVKRIGGSPPLASVHPDESRPGGLRGAGLKLSCLLTDNQMARQGAESASFSSPPCNRPGGLDGDDS